LAVRNAAAMAAGRQAGQGCLALQSTRGLDIPGLGGHLGEFATLFQPLNQVGCLGAQPARDLVVAPFRLDLVPDFIKAAFA